MSNDNVRPIGDAAAIKRLREKPIEYSVKLTHMVVGGEWVLGIQVLDLAELDARNRETVAFDLRQAADMIENGEWEAKPL